MILPSDNRRFRLRVGIVLAGTLLAVSSAYADHAFVLRDGRKVAIEESSTEFAVMLTSGDASTAFAQRMADAGFAVADFNDNAESAVKIVTVGEAAEAQRQVLVDDPAVVDVQRVFRLPGGEVPAVTTGQLLAKVQGGLSAAERSAVWADHGLVMLRAIDGLPDVYLLRPTEPGADEVLIGEQLADDARTTWAHPNLRAPKMRMQVAVQDELFSQQWHLHNTEQRGGEEDADIDGLEAWDITEGRAVLFGMFDDSCDVEHEDLRAGYIGIGHDPEIPRGRPGSEDPRPKQRGDNHGTRVMGLAVAQANDLGGRGVAPRARFTVSRGLGGPLDFVADAGVYLFALRQNVDVHINSWGYSGGLPNPPIVVEAIEVLFTSGRNKGDVDGDGIEDRLGTVVLFSSGNENSSNFEGFEISTIPQVIAVGASGLTDRRTGFSNFGESLSVLAPGVLTFTTDNTDRPGIADPGANVGGENPFETDDTGKYTDFFSGTSAACPIAAGVAGLVLSVNPLLTATDVRLILEHTADRVSPGDADYDRLTSHSLTYGYGRVNARRAAEAAELSAADESAVWPDAPMDVRASQTQLRFRQTVNTDEFLVLESDNPISFIPEDGTCYAPGQTACTRTESLPGSIRVLAVGCALSCDGGEQPACDCGVQQCVTFERAELGRKHFAIFAHNSAGLYSWGVAADTDGNVRGEARILDEDHPSCTNAPAIGPPVGGGTRPPPSGPAVAIMASPLSGSSPLTVTFRGNAVSPAPIDDSRTAWDFDTSDGILVDATSRNAVHTYEAEPGTTRTFTARLTMFDVQGNAGSAQVAITVEGAERPDTGGLGGTARIRASVPGTLGSTVTAGTSPFTVLLGIDASTLTSSGDTRSISANWDLGDGTQASGLSVLHTYINESTTEIRVPVTATVTVTNESGATFTEVATTLLTVRPGTARPDTSDPVLPGAGARGEGGLATPCGAMGLIPFLGLISGMWLLRRRR